MGVKLTWKCTECEFAGLRSKLIKHVKEVHSDHWIEYWEKYVGFKAPIKCLHCGVKLELDENHVVHLLRYWAPRKFCCTECRIAYLCNSSDFWDEEARQKMSNTMREKHKRGEGNLDIYHNTASKEKKHETAVRGAQTRKERYGTAWMTQRVSQVEKFLRDEMAIWFPGSRGNVYKPISSGRKVFLDIVFNYRGREFNLEVDGLDFHEFNKDLNTRDKYIYSDYGILTLRVEANRAWTITKPEIINACEELLSLNGPYWVKYHNERCLNWWRYNCGKLNACGSPIVPMILYEVNNEQDKTES